MFTQVLNRFLYKCYLFTQVLIKMSYEMQLYEDIEYMSILRVCKTNSKSYFNTLIQFEHRDNESNVIKTGLCFNVKEFKWFLLKVGKGFNSALWFNKTCEIYYECDDECINLYQKRPGVRVLWRLKNDDYNIILKNKKLIFDLLYNFDAKIKELNNSNKIKEAMQWEESTGQPPNKKIKHDVNFHLKVDELDEEPQTISLF